MIDEEIKAYWNYIDFRYGVGPRLTGRAANLLHLAEGFPSSFAVFYNPISGPITVEHHNWTEELKGNDGIDFL